MFCTKCGAPNPNDYNFCVNCGSPLPKTQNGQYSPYTQPMGASVKSFGETIKNLAASPVLIFAIISYVLYIIFSTANTFMAGYDVVKVASNEQSEMLEIMLKLTTIIGIIPSFLMVIGLVLAMESGIHYRKNGNTTGLTVVKVGLYLNTVITIVNGAIGLYVIYRAYELYLVIAGMNGIPVYKQDKVLVQVVVAIVVIAVVLAISIIVYSLLIRMVDKIKWSLEDDEPTERLSTCVAVLLLLGAFLGMVAGIINFAQNDEPIGLISTLCGALAYGLFGTFIFKYNYMMDELKINP